MGPEVICTCVVCGKEFPRPKMFQRKTCGWECLQEFRKRVGGRP